MHGYGFFNQERAPQQRVQQGPGSQGYAGRDQFLGRILFSSVWLTHYLQMKIDRIYSLMVPEAKGHSSQPELQHSASRLSVLSR